MSDSSRPRETAGATAGVETRLIVQHPALADATVAALSHRVGSAPLDRGPTRAVWDGTGLDSAMIATLAEHFDVDAAQVPAGARLGDYRLLAFDMDSTLITIECIDEIADFAGRKAEVAAITEAAMRGEIADYDESLRRRVALLAGLDAAVLDRVYDERLRLTPGAETLIAAARRQGLRTLLVSGGFTHFTERLRTRLAIDQARANVLEIRDGRLTGARTGPIVNAAGKARARAESCAA
ncbi:MAG: phosphoserine phosphatase SerB, partial [Lautropia sp.]